MRSATLADAPRIAGYHHECWLLAYTPLLPAAEIAGVEPQLDLWTDWLRPDSDFTTMVLVDDNDLAFAHTTVRDHQLVHLFVAPERQGNGLGRQMLDVGERLIRQAGHEQAELHTRVGNVVALSLYQSSGWELTDELVQDPLPNGGSYPEHVLRKRLDLSCQP